jgi:plasmid maintenance system antidote protein VapI
MIMIGYDKPDAESSAPGCVLNDEVIAPLGLSVTDAAEGLGMSRVAFFRLP